MFEKMPWITIRLGDFDAQNARNLSFVRFTDKKYTLEQTIISVTYDDVQKTMCLAARTSSMVNKRNV